MRSCKECGHREGQYCTFNPPVNGARKYGRDASSYPIVYVEAHTAHYYMLEPREEPEWYSVACSKFSLKQTT